MLTLIKIMEQTQAGIDVLPDDKKQDVINKLVKLAKKMIQDLGSFSDVPKEYSFKIYPAMKDQLSAAEKRTEKAADDIMSAAEIIMAQLPSINGPAKDKIQNAINQIFEASSFQDLVAQHLNEVKLLATDFDADMKAMGEMMDEIGTGGDSSKRPSSPNNKRPDAHLLNGPSTNF